MTDQEIDVVIAEACGWKCEKLGEHPGFPNGILATWYSPDGKHRLIPSYCTDLNAMHEAMPALTDKQRYQYLIELEDCVRESVGRETWRKSEPYERFYWMHTATARQRAEAFLRTVGKWKGLNLWPRTTRRRRR